MYSESYFDQVEKKKQRLEKVNNSDDNDGVVKSALPTRMELHHSNKRKKKGKSKFPLLKVLLTFFILLPISTILAYTYFSHHQSLKVDSKNAGGEEVLYETNKNDSGNPPIQQNQNNDLAKNTESNSSQSSTQSDRDSDSNINETTKVSTDVQNNSNSNEQVNNEQKNENTNTQIINHVVGPNETLFSISMKYYHSKDGIEKIIQQNQIVNNEIQVGQSLQIPLTK